MRDTETFIVEADKVKEHSPYTELVPTIEDAFYEYASGNVTMPAKQYLYIDEHNGDFRSMPAYIRGRFNASGVKWVNVHPENTQLPTVMGVVIYTDPRTGEPRAVLNGTELTGRRTGAAAAVATDHLADENATVMGLIGAGAQAYEQLRAINTVRNIRDVIIVDQDPEAVDMFKETFEDEFNVKEGTIEDATRCDILSTITPVEEPIVDSVKEGIHINAMGADAPDKQEFDPSILSSSKSRIIIDDREQCVHSGEISKALESGAITEEDIHSTLGDVVKNGVEFNKGTTTTIFDSTGLAIQDIATAHLIYESILDTKDDVMSSDIM